MKFRLDYLDSIRGVAALLVVLHHTFEWFIKHFEINYPILVNLFETFNLGRFGVLIFFLTSGFLIPWSLKRNTPHPLKNFVIKRFFRLYPAYWFSIIPAVIIGTGVGMNIISTDQVLLNFTMIHKFLGVESVIESYWTLHVELIFYFLCVILFSLNLLQNNAYLIMLTIVFSLCAVAVAALGYYYHIRIPVLMPQGLAIMFYGSLLCNYFIKKQSELLKPLVILTVLYLILLSVADKFYYVDSWLKWFFTHLAAFFMFFLLITKVKLNNRIAVYLGRISYSLYLLHTLVINVVFKMFGNFAETELGFYIVMISVLAGSILVADLSYRFIEKPGVRLAGKLTQKYRDDVRKVIA